MKVYLEPRDVPAAEARKVLDFLNAARTPREIHEGVELPDERDVGLRVGARLLARRDELGGFTALQQVADVPQVGPERFTEIVVALTGLDVQRLLATGTLADLERQVRELRAAVAALGGAAARPLVRIIPLAAAPFLGEPVPLVVEVTRPDGEPAVDAPVHLVATWGRLRASDGYTVGDGSALTVHADIFGRATATLTPPTSEDLRDVQQAALETSLASLDHAAPTPSAAAAGLRELARQYRWEAAADLRRAVDVYFRDFRPRLLETINFRDYSSRWGYLESTVTAAAVSETAVEGLASSTIRFTDWLSAWLEVFLALVEEEAGLLDRLRSETGRTKDAGELLDGVHRRVRAFVDGQRGVAGTYAGQIVAERSLLSFLDSEVVELPLDARLRLHPALTTQSRTVASLGAAALVAIEQTRTEARDEIRERVPRITGDVLGGILGRELEPRLAAFAADQDARLEARVAPLEGELATKLDASALTELSSTLGRRVSVLEEGLVRKADVGEIGRLRTELADRVATFDRRVVNLERRVQ